MAKPRSQVHHPQSAAKVLDARVRALTKELGLDQRQQAGVREALIRERLAILELRKGAAPGTTDVVAASHAIVARTRGDIRSLLNDEQKKRYFADVPEDKLAPAQADRDYWLTTTKPKAPQPEVPAPAH